MPKYYEFKVCGYYLYYTASCVIEAMHVLAGESASTVRRHLKYLFVQGMLEWMKATSNIRYMI